MYVDLLDQGYACIRRSDPEAAARYFRQASEFGPGQPQAYFGLAQAYIDQGGMGDEAIKVLQKALQLDPQYVPARAYLGIELLKQYKVQDAQDELEHALQDEPKNLLVRIKYAEYYYRLGFYHRSVEMLEIGLKSPNGANEHIVAMARNLLTQARQKCKGIVLRDPPDPRSLWRSLVQLFSSFKPKAEATKNKVEFN